MTDESTVAKVVEMDAIFAKARQRHDDFGTGYLLGLAQAAKEAVLIQLKRAEQKEEDNNETARSS